MQNAKRAKHLLQDCPIIFRPVKDLLCHAFRQCADVAVEVSRYLTTGRVCRDQPPKC